MEGEGRIDEEGGKEAAHGARGLGASGFVCPRESGSVIDEVGKDWIRGRPRGRGKGVNMPKGEGVVDNDDEVFESIDCNELGRRDETVAEIR